MKKEKKIIWLLTGIAAVSLLVLCTVVIVRTATYPFIRTTGPDGPPRSVEPSAQAVERLAGGIRIPTVSDAIDRTDDNPFQAFKAYLPQAYPAIYSQLDTLTINEYGLVFRWPGKNPALPPILLSSYEGFRQTDRTMIDAARNLGARPAAILQEVGLPSSIPILIAGIRIGLANGWMALVGAEIIAGNGSHAGLGYLFAIPRSTC